MTNLNKRVNAATPIINFEYNEISVDISLAILDSETVPPDIEYNMPNEML